MTADDSDQTPAPLTKYYISGAGRKTNRGKKQKQSGEGVTQIGDADPSQLVCANSGFPLEKEFFKCHVTVVVLLLLLLFVWALFWCMILTPAPTITPTPNAASAVPYRSARAPAKYTRAIASRFSGASAKC